MQVYVPNAARAVSVRAAPQKHSQDQASHCLPFYRLLALYNYSDAHPGPTAHVGLVAKKVVVQFLCQMRQVAVCWSS